MKAFKLTYLFFFVFPVFSIAQSNLQFTNLCDTLSYEVQAECEELEIYLAMSTTTDCSLGPFLIHTLTFDYFSDGFVDEVISGPIEYHTFGYGEHLVTYTAEDQCGTSISCVRTILLYDITPPYFDCNQVVRSLNINNPEVIVLPDEVISFYSDDCTQADDLNLSFSLDGTLNQIQIDCNDMPISGNETYTVYATDAAGNIDSCQFEFFLQVNIPFCNTIWYDSLPICVTTPTDEYVSNVLVNDFLMLPSLTLGCDFFDPVNLFFNIRPEKNTAIGNGVDLLDYILLNEHFREVQLFNDHYKMMAADLSSTLGGLGISDLNRLRLFLLKVNDDFGSNTSSWRFVLADHIFPTPNYLSNYPNVISVDDPFPIPLEFIGVKIGDINSSADPTEQTMGIQPPSVGELNLCTNDVFINSGEDFYVYLTSDNFDEMRGFQFSIEFDTTKLFFHQIIRNGLDEFDNSTANVEMIAQGKIGALWVPKDGHPFSLAVGDSLCRIHFTALEDFQLSDVFSINNVLIEKEAYSTSGRLDVNFQFCNALSSTENSETILDVNVIPNPFNEFTEIKFQLFENEYVTLTIFDISGKEIKSFAQNFPASHNSFLIEKNDLPMDGIYFYKIQLEDYVHSGKFIFQN